MGVCLPYLFEIIWCSASFLLIFCGSVLNTSFFNNKINSKEICQHTYGNLRPLNQNPGGKPWENEQIIMNKGDFIKTNIQELTKKTQQKWFLKSVEFLDVSPRQRLLSSLSFYSIRILKKIVKNYCRTMKNASKIYFWSNNHPKTWRIDFKFLIKVYRSSFFSQKYF